MLFGKKDVCVLLDVFSYDVRIFLKGCTFIRLKISFDVVCYDLRFNLGLICS